MPKQFLDPQGLSQFTENLEQSIIAAEYDSTATYALGDYCVYENLLYRCTTAITTAESWTSGHWTQILVMGDLKLKTQIQTVTTQQYEALSADEKANGTYVITDTTSVPLTASAIPYDNTSSGLTATDVQEAIDEVAAGGGGGGTSNYNDLSNKPQVNGVTLSGDKDSSDLGIVWQGTQAQYDALTTIDPNTVYYITDATGTVLATVATTGSYNDLSNKPQIDTSLDTTSSNAIANGPVASAVQTISQTVSNKMDKANPTGTGSLSLNRKANTTVGNYSVAVGETNEASGPHAFAEGLGCKASGDRAHAEGYNCTASGATAHAEGYNCEASGSGSHAEGDNTIANHNSQHVFGTYNLADTSSELPTAKGNYAEIVGNGTSTNSRSNARTLDWAGNEVLAGGLKVYGNKDVAVVNSFTNDITTTADGLAAITIPTGVGINNIFSIVVQNPAGLYLYGFLIKQPSVLWANIRNYNGTAYASQSCTVRLFYFE